MFPSMLGARGRAYLTLLTVAVLCRGPVSNIRRNVEAAALALSCNLDLQVNHSRLLWRDAVRPLLLISQRLQDGDAAFQLETLDATRKFQDIRDEVVLQYGYDSLQTQPAAAGASASASASASTQEQFTAKTVMQCDSESGSEVREVNMAPLTLRPSLCPGVVDRGVQRCVHWFRLRWEECMNAIPVPIINHILCVSMKFHFLCDVMRVMTPWCRELIPVEGNFGQLFDQLNQSMDSLSREFSTKVVLQEQQQSMLVEDQLGLTFSQSITGSFQKLSRAMEQLLDVLQLLLSFTFVTIVIQALLYLRQYRRDLRFDNIYITGYFRRIDARRKRRGKSFLLPLKPSEKKTLITPWSLRVHQAELSAVTSGVLQVLSILMLAGVLLSVDVALVHVLDIVGRHTVAQFNLTSSHQVDIKVGGDSMMARLLRKTVSAFNSSSSLDIRTDNEGCVCPPSSLPAAVYVSCVCCVLLGALLSCLQVYTNRLRRHIAAMYHPQREKQRVSFLYHLQLQRRVSSTDRKRIISQRQTDGMVLSVASGSSAWPPGPQRGLQVLSVASRSSAWPPGPQRGLRVLSVASRSSAWPPGPQVLSVASGSSAWPPGPQFLSVASGSSAWPPGPQRGLRVLSVASGSSAWPPGPQRGLRVLRSSAWPPGPSSPRRDSPSGPGESESWS
ncbi:uncharacterized protein V6R79_018856 [Siganus canaliculatus]